MHDTDRELLMRAARAAGIAYEPIKAGVDVWPGGLWMPTQAKWWNPLASWDDAMELAVKLRIEVFFTSSYVRAGVRLEPRAIPVKIGDDPSAATRRAITRCAAATLAGADGGSE